MGNIDLGSTQYVVVSFYFFPAWTTWVPKQPQVRIQTSVPVSSHPQNQTCWGKGWKIIAQHFRRMLLEHYWSTLGGIHSSNFQDMPRSLHGDWNVFIFLIFGWFVLCLLFLFFILLHVFPSGFWELQSDEPYRPLRPLQNGKNVQITITVPTCWGQTWAICEGPTQV